ncbi:hypothetical protein BDQ12DRAFT_683798 [Crucibulum laeve]|uniref:Uncharacterized protein n=1 Tax=Crucibulum laeve TaxID=68775 RepID=A0A5C3M178_9AGAR|nr:hypothetical protein BDQ12DRAFT_683798 [Crucibulum laeve]
MICGDSGVFCSCQQPLRPTGVCTLSENSIQVFTPQRWYSFAEPKYAILQTQ